MSLDTASKLPVYFESFKNVVITILVAFVCNAKSFAIAVLVCFFSTPFLSSRFFRRTTKSSYNELLPRKRETKIQPISLVTRNKFCVTNVVDVICDACNPCNAMCFTLFTVTSIHNIQKYTKIRNSKKRWKVTQKIQGSKEREIDSINRKV